MAFSLAITAISLPVSKCVLLSAPCKNPVGPFYYGWLLINSTWAFNSFAVDYTKRNPLCEGDA